MEREGWSEWEEGGEEKQPDEASEAVKGTVKTAIDHLAWGLMQIFNAEVASGWWCLQGRGAY